MRFPKFMTLRRVVLTSVALVVTAVVLVTTTSCGLVSAFGDAISQAFNGQAATMATFDQFGQPIDRVHGVSFRVSRDDRFDTSNSDGTSNNDSSVLLISLGESHISHVGSTMLLAQDGLTDVTAQFGSTQVAFDNAQPGTPWLNDLFERNRNLWAGKAKTIVIRSQNGSPIAVYAGNQVEAYATDVPKSTWFRVDGLNLLVYRADYTVYDNDLLVNRQ